MKKGMSVWKGMSGKKKTAVAIVSLAGICILGTGVFWARNKMSKGQPVGNASVQEASAASGDIANTITGTGSLEADDSDTVKIPSGITIKEVKVESGDAVSKGDVLAVVEETSVLGAMEEVQEQIEETEEDMNECKSDTETQEVTAKVSGRIKKIYVQESSDVAQSMVDNGALMLLSLDGKMAADFTGVSGVAAGDTVTVTLSDGTVKEGSVESVSGADCTVTFSDDGVAVDDTVTAAKADGTKIGTGKAYIHEQLEITGTGGTVSSVSAAENQEVSAGDTLLTVNTGENCKIPPVGGKKRGTYPESSEAGDHFPDRNDYCGHRRYGRKCECFCWKRGAEQFRRVIGNYFFGFFRCKSQQYVLYFFCLRGFFSAVVFGV